MEDSPVIYNLAYKLNEHSLSSERPINGYLYSETQSIDDFIKNLKITITDIDNMVMEFDMINADPALANAIRRIIIAEIPTMAIDQVLIYNNTSVLPDEVLAHRLGMLPIKVDPRLFQYREPGDENGTEEDTIKFQLKAKCSKISNPDYGYNYEGVFSKDLEFVPLGNQKEMYGVIRPVQEDILLNKLQPGHEIDLEAHCVKNIGRVHAKFSPVATAWYRLLPQIKLKEEISGERAYRLAECFAEDVIKIVKKKGIEIAKVRDPRKMMCSRNIYQHDDLKDVVEISKIKHHFIFTIESTGALSPETLVIEAINILKEKCRYFLAELKALKI